MRIVFSGGGTGGHIFPAIAMADAFMRLRPDAKIKFIGAEGKMEMERVPKAGYEIEGLWIGGFQRKLTWQNLIFPAKLMSSLWKARGILKKFKPDAVVGVGGYASGPTLEMAVRMNIPTLIQEQNSYPGITNKLLAGRVDKICTAYEGLEKFFPAEKIKLTGNPVRKDLQDIKSKRSEAIRFFDLDSDKKTILLFGGSLGARSLNEAVRDNFEKLEQLTDVQVIWQVGKLYKDEFSQCDSANLPNVKLHPFLNRMDLAYAAADIIIGRAGALTVSELCIVAKPVILIPSPNVAEDHQTKNAMALSEKSAAILIKDSEAVRWLDKSLEVLQDQVLIQKLSLEISKLAKPNADQIIAEEILRLTEKFR